MNIKMLYQVFAKSKLEETHRHIVAHMSDDWSEVLEDLARFKDRKHAELFADQINHEAGSN